MSKAILNAKDPDALSYSGLSAEENAKISEKYAECGEYFKIEVDFKTLKCRLVPVSEWR